MKAWLWVTVDLLPLLVIKPDVLLLCFCFQHVWAQKALTCSLMCQSLLHGVMCYICCTSWMKRWKEFFHQLPNPHGKEHLLAVEKRYRSPLQTVPCKSIHTPWTFCYIAATKFICRLLECSRINQHKKAHNREVEGKILRFALLAKSCSVFLLLFF